MAKKDVPLIAKVNFPNYLATDAEKANESYGLDVAQAIQHEWFNQTSNGSCGYYDNWLGIHRSRLYSRGEQPIGQYQDRMKVNGDLSKLNLNWSIVKIVPKYVDIVVNGMNNRLFTPKAFAQDVTSSEERDLYQRTIAEDMIAQEFLKQTMDEFGIDAFNIPQDQIPNSDQELQLHMQLEFKPAIEIAEEEAISTVFEMNNFLNIKYRYDTDQVVLGRGFVKHEYLHTEGIKISYVDPQNTIHSYTEDPYYKDVFYWGEVKRIPILELKKIKPSITKEEIAQVMATGNSWSSTYTVMKPHAETVFDKDVTNVLYFRYKMDKNFVYKIKTLENGGRRAIRKDDEFNPEESEFFERVEKKIDVWYEGVLILGTNILLKWELMKNMVRPEAATQRAYSGYIGVAPKLYNNTYDSLVDRMIPFADLIQLTHLKTQQVLQKIVPDGVFIDADGLVGINLGDGAVYGPQQALDLYMTTGSVIGRSKTDDGEFNNARIPIQELTTSSGQSKLNTLITTLNSYMGSIQSVTGLNEARDASNPDANSLVGLQKMAALNSNTATRHILEAGLDMTKQLAEGVSIRISDVLEHAEDAQELANQIGKSNVATLDKIKDLPLYSFGIFIEVSPDEEEKANVETNIQLALKSGSILLEDAEDIRQVKNPKLANELLKLKTRKKEEKDQKQKEFDLQAQTASAIQSQQAIAQAKMQQIDAEAKAKTGVEQAKTQGEIAVLQESARLKEKLMGIEHAYAMEIEGQAVARASDLEKEKDEAKLKRIDKQSSNTSTMITQRQSGTPARTFESTNDTMEDIDLGDFG